MASWLLQHDLRSFPLGAPIDSIYLEGLAMCEWVDSRGCPRVVLSEHHATPDGYLPSPFVYGAAVAARTSTMRIMVSALVLTLRDPVSAAEDAAVLDILSGGRLELTLVAGYVAEEFALFGIDYENRGETFERKARIFLALLGGEEVDSPRGRVRITPLPLQRPRPFVAIGGRAPKRAARLGDAFMPPVASPALAEAYRLECRRLGRGDGLLLDPGGPMGVFVCEDPERTWALIGPQLLHETNAYGAWAHFAGEASPFVEETDESTLRRSDRYAVVTPQECVALAASLPEGAVLRLKPLAGGIDPAIGWESLELFVEKVAPLLS